MVNRCFRVFFVLIFSFSFTSSNVMASSKIFQKFGDVFQFTPVIAAFITMGKKDWEGLKDLSISTATTISTVYVSKYLFGLTKASFTERPFSKSNSGFPSGHTASAFVGAGFVQKRYGWKYGLPFTIVGSLVGISRINAKKHTPFQVVTGAAIGYTAGYFMTSRYEDKKGKTLAVYPYVGSAGTLDDNSAGVAIAMTY